MDLLTGILECRMVFAAQFSGPKGDLSDHLCHLTTHCDKSVQLVLFDLFSKPPKGYINATPYSDFIARAELSCVSDLILLGKESLVRASDVLNIQFTSGQYEEPTWI